MDNIYLFPPDDNPQKKTCTGRVGKSTMLLLSTFIKQKVGRGGLRSSCKECCNAYHKAHKSKPEVKDGQKQLESLFTASQGTMSAY